MINAKQMERYKKQLSNYIKKAKDTFILSLLENFITLYGERFYTAPAAKKNHGNYPGGLLEHTIRIIKIAESIRKSSQPTANKNIILAGAIFHDCGKMEVYVDTGHKDTNKRYSYSDIGSALGHKYLSLKILKACAGKTSNCSVLTSLEHIILSHDSSVRGVSEMDSKTIEAVIVSYADMLEFVFNRWEVGKSEERTSVYDRVLRKNFLYNL